MTHPVNVYIDTSVAHQISYSITSLLMVSLYGKKQVMEYIYTFNKGGYLRVLVYVETATILPIS